MEDFLIKEQVEELYDETIQQELHEYYEWLQQKEESSQSWRESLCKDSPVWESKVKDCSQEQEDLRPQKAVGQRVVLSCPVHPLSLQ